jgi:chromosome segregation ATPase
LSGFIFYYRAELADYRNIESEYSSDKREYEARYNQLESINNELRESIERLQGRIDLSEAELDRIRTINRRTEKQLLDVGKEANNITEAVKNIREQIAILQTHYNSIKSAVSD